MVRIFGGVRLKKNLGKTKAMVCNLEFIWGKLVVVTYKRRSTGEGDKFREGNKTRVSCKECGMAMAASPLRHHMEIAHGIVVLQTLGVGFDQGVPNMYAVSFQWLLKSLACPVDMCLEG